MIFNSKKDIKQEIKSKIYRFYEDKFNLSYTDLYKELIPLLNNYLYELRILKEINSFELKVVNEDLFLILEINKDLEIVKYELNIGIHQYRKDKRLMKINKIDK